MANVLIAKDVPKWLLQVADKADWHNADVVDEIRKQMNTYLPMLKQKTSNYAAINYSTNCPQDVVDTINKVDWNGSSALTLTMIKVFVEQYI